MDSDEGRVPVTRHFPFLLLQEVFCESVYV